MGFPEFGPGPVSEEQWARINELAVSLKPGQALWVSGYFAGYERGVQAAAAQPLAPGAPAPGARTLTVLYGSETGNSAALAKALVEAARGQGLVPAIADMADYKPRKLKDEQDLVVVTSTHGEGDPPQSAADFFEYLEGHKAPRLPGLRYAVLALGDSTYERYCEAGKRVDRRLAELGATALLPRVDCDVDYDDAAAGWTAALVEQLAAGPAPAGAVPAAIVPPAREAYGKRRPFQARVIDSFVLTGRGSTKETRHVELSVEGSDLAFEPGDALGIVPRNDPHLVEALLEALALPADARAAVKDRATTLAEALSADFEITAATPRFLEHWAGLSGDAGLVGLLEGDRAADRAAFLRENHVIDLVRRYPVPGIGGETFVTGLRPLQPRLYSIASSIAAIADEVHLTVSTVRYVLHGQPRAGVASGHLAERAPPDATVPVYVQANPHFRLAADDVPIIMIGAGTGVAPYRAFMQEREARGAGGRSWLFFGERNFRSDFLYQTEWQDLLRRGVLSRMTVAFSRDRAEKRYVQHRLIEHGHDVHAWLEDGACLYVCGDAQTLAPAVHAALAAILQEHGGLGPDAAEEHLRGVQRERRYRIDVY